MAKYKDQNTGLITEVGDASLNPDLIAGKTLVPDTTATGSISSESLAPQPTINIPPAPTTDYLGNTNSTNDVINSYIANTPKPPSLSDAYKGLQDTPEFQAKETAYNTSKADLDALNAEIQGLTYQKDVVIPNQNEQDVLKGNAIVTKGGLAPKTASEQRAILLKLAPLQYNALIKSAEVTNNANILNTAQKHIDNIFQVYSKDVENDYNYKKDLRDKVYEFATAKEKEQLDKMNKEDDRKFELLKLDIGRANEMAKEASSNGQADIASKLLSLDPKSPTYSKDVANLTAQIKPKSDIQFISATANQPAGYFDKTTGKFTPLSGGGNVSGIQALTQTKSNIDEISGVLKQGGLSTAVGTSPLSRSPSGFWGLVGKFLSGATGGAIVGASVGSVAGGVGAIPAGIAGGLIGGTFATGKDVYSKLTGQQQNFIGTVEQIKSQLSLDKLIQTKASGATFGSLTEGEWKKLDASATKIGSWAIHEDGDPTKPVIGYNVSEQDFKKEMDKINNFAKLDYIIKGGDPSTVGVDIMPNGEYWTHNSDGTYTSIK